MIEQALPKTSLARLIEWVQIPGGQVTIVGAKDSYILQGESLTCEVAPFAIAKYPITNAQFQTFVDDAYDNPAWWDYSDDAREWRANHPQPTETMYPGSHHPRTNVSWYDAVAFCRWISRETNDDIFLPTEQQWQRAAQGDTDWAYVWGDEFDADLCNNSVEQRSDGTMQVTRFIDSPSPYGVVDMCGSVWEWCLTKYATGGIELKGAESRVLRGGSWQSDHPTFLRVDFRNWHAPDRRLVNRGFRPVRL